MHILYRPIPSPILLDEHIRLEIPVFDAVRVEFHLLSGGGVDERVDHLVEGVEEEGNVYDERSSETLGVVVLKDVQDLCRRVAYDEHSAKFVEGEAVTVRAVEKDGLFALSP